MATINRILIVAHPDDEIIWFPANVFDHIYIVFLGRHDKPFMKKNRLTCLNNHPLKHKISLGKIDESGIWKDPNRKKLYFSIKIQVIEYLKRTIPYNVSEIYTHNASGEYGHDDHVLINHVVNKLFSHTHRIWTPAIGLESTEKFDLKKILNFDLDFYQKTKNIYQKYKAWTWSDNYQPQEKQLFLSKRNFNE